MLSPGKPGRLLPAGLFILLHIPEPAAMLNAMNTYIGFIGKIMLLLAVLLPAQAQLYKGVDAEGNVVYSDKPFENAESITPPSLSVMDAPRVEKPAAADTTEEEEEKPETEYTQFRIMSPSDGDTIWNEPNLRINMRLVPDLAIAEGHSIWLLMDGRPYIKNSGSPLVVVGRPERGPHTFQGVVRTDDGRTLKQTRPVQVFIKHGSVQKRAR